MTRRRGFSIVELVIVLALIGILTGIALPAVRVGRDRARAAKVQSHLDQLRLRITQVCASLGTCTDPNNAAVFGPTTAGTTPAWLRDSLSPLLQFDRRADAGYLLEWAPVSAASTTGTRTLPNCQRCRVSNPSSCPAATITERRTTIGSYAMVAVIDVQNARSNLGNQLSQALGVNVLAQGTGQYPNRWLFPLVPIAYATATVDTTPNSTSTWRLVCTS